MTLGVSTARFFLVTGRDREHLWLIFTLFIQVLLHAASKPFVQVKYVLNQPRFSHDCFSFLSNSKQITLATVVCHSPWIHYDDSSDSAFRLHRNKTAMYG